MTPISKAFSDGPLFDEAPMLGDEGGQRNHNTDRPCVSLNRNEEGLKSSSMPAPRCRIGMMTERFPSRDMMTH